MKKVQISCFQHIPCDPCRFACPQGAITKGQLTDLPQVDLEKCTGCGLCIAVCPGQACAVLDDSFAPGKAALRFPYEFFPLPQKGQVVQAVNNQGEILCEATVESVLDLPRNDHTRIVTISFAQAFAGKVCGMRRIKSVCSFSI